jgi:hypothetical protein
VAFVVIKNIHQRKKVIEKKKEKKKRETRKEKKKERREIEKHTLVEKKAREVLVWSLSKIVRIDRSSIFISKVTICFLIF